MPVCVLALLFDDQLSALLHGILGLEIPGWIVFRCATDASPYPASRKRFLFLVPYHEPVVAVKQGRCLHT